MYQAPLWTVHYQPGGARQPAPDPQRCPEYYRSESLPAWFEIGRIRRVGVIENALSEHLFSEKNRAFPQRTVTGLHRTAIGEAVPNVPFLDSNVSLWFLTPVKDVGVRERSSVAQPLDRGSWACKGRYLIHLSDLHFGAEHVFRNPLGEAQLGKESLAEALLSDLASIGIRDADVSAVLVTGDLTWHGDPHEFANAEAFLDQLAQKLGLHHAQIIIIPGNHDIEWRTGKGNVDLNAELNYRKFVKDFYHSEPTSSLLRITRLTIANRPWTVVALNSCRIESEENAGLGFVGREQLLEATKFLHSIGAGGDETRIALVHHHLLPVNYIEDYDFEQKKLSITLDAEAVVRSLMSRGVKAVFHGHQHQPYVAQLRRIIQGFVDPLDGGVTQLSSSITVVDGGSIGVRRAHLNVVGRNAYTIIDAGAEHGQLALRTRIQSPVGPGFTDYQQEILSILA